MEGPLVNLVSPKRNTLRLFVGAAAVIVLTACGSVYPGAAAVVEGTEISMSTADETAAAYCVVSLISAKQQGINELSGADTRRQAVSDLVTHAVAQRVAKSEGVKADPKLYELSDDQVAQIHEAFKDSNPDQVENAILMAQETYALTVAIGEKSAGMALDENNGQAIQAAGESTLVKAMENLDIQVDGRFGLDDLTVQISATGSLSVDEENLAEIPVDELPATQRCA